MSGRTNGVECFETTEVVVVTEECLPPDHAVIPVLEPAQTPIQKLLDAVGKGENPEAGGGFYCEECVTLFQDQSDAANISGPSFVLDFQTSVGVPQRALLTLPFGLTIGRSSIPRAGIGVINHGTVVSPGMHYGPYEGEVTTREDALASDFSWEICKGKNEYKYIDAARESHSNWMRYVNCARSKDETNLLAVQYKDSILYHCCRSIQPGDELMVWPGAKLLARLSQEWTQAWLTRLKSAESDEAAQIFPCSQCQLPFTTEAFLQRHVDHFHPQPATEVAEVAEVAEPEQPAAAAASLVVLSVDESKTCGDCGKTFKQLPHLRRHQLCVHSNRRPYGCPQCRRTFSQASGLVRHQLVHRKQAALRAPARGEDPGGAPEICADAANGAEETGEGGQEAVEAAGGGNGEAGTPPPACPDCGKSFASETALRKHWATVHERLRPYACAACHKCFGQHNDLTRHLRRHRGGRAGPPPPPPGEEEEGAAMPFGCAECSLSFPSVDSLQLHIAGLHSEDAEAAESRDGDPAPDDDESRDPDFVPPAAETADSAPSQRPRRLGARSRLSAITKLIAPRRRADVRKKPPEAAEVAVAAGNGEPPKYKWFSCNRCRRTYGNPEDLRAHECGGGEPGPTPPPPLPPPPRRQRQRPERAAPRLAGAHRCERCGRAFATPGNLRQHRRSNACDRYHCASELFACAFCPFSFTARAYLAKHVKRHHPAERLEEEEEEAAAAVGEEEPEEAGGEGEEKEYTCPRCGKSLGGASRRRHACPRQLKVLYLCTDCGKGFANHYGLKQHQRVHTGEKPHGCPHCGKGFSYTGQLTVHLRTHTGERPYLCTHCGESFRQSGDLKRHERKHTGVRPHRCPECCKSFSRPQSLRAHQMLHRGQRMFKCSQCGKSFSRNYHLRRHHQKMHS